MNERPIIITISNYNDEEITYLLPKNSTVEILKTIYLDEENSGQLEIFKIEITCENEEGIKEILN